MEDTRDAVYRVKEGKFFMCHSDGYASYSIDVTEMITHFVVLSEPTIQ